MKRISIAGLCLMAVFALSAMAASSASAADLLARIAGGGNIGGTNLDITFLSLGGAGLLTTHGGNTIHCKDVHDHGLFLTATLGNVLLLFLGCTSSGFSCSTAGVGAGSIHIPLTALFHLGLAHLDSTHRSIPAAVVLLPSGGIEITCLFVKIKVTGAAIGALQNAAGEPAPLNVALSQVNLAFQQTANGLQHLRSILMPGSTTPTEYDLRSSFGGEPELAAEVANATLHLFRLSNGKHVSLELTEP